MGRSPRSCLYIEPKSQLLPDDDSDVRVDYQTFHFVVGGMLPSTVTVGRLRARLAVKFTAIRRIDYECFAKFAA